MLKKQQLVSWSSALTAFVLVLGLDLWSKGWVWSNLRDGSTVDVVPPWLEFAFSYNRGTAFSVIRVVDHPWIFIPITAAVIGGVVMLSLRSPGVTTFRTATLGVIAGGALGNLHDRIFRVDEVGEHGVVDFIKFNYPDSWPLEGSWPSFNVADMALVVGVALLMISVSRGDSKAGG